MLISLLMFYLLVIMIFLLSIILERIRTILEDLILILTDYMSLKLLIIILYWMLKTSLMVMSKQSLFILMKLVL